MEGSWPLRLARRSSKESHEVHDQAVRPMKDGAGKQGLEFPVEQTVDQAQRHDERDKDDPRAERHGDQRVNAGEDDGLRDIRRPPQFFIRRHCPGKKEAAENELLSEFGDLGERKEDFEQGHDGERLHRRTLSQRLLEIDEIGVGEQEHRQDIKQYLPGQIVRRKAEQTDGRNLSQSQRAANAEHDHGKKDGGLIEFLSRIAGEKIQGGDEGVVDQKKILGQPRTDTRYGSGLFCFVLFHGINPACA